MPTPDVETVAVLIVDPAEGQRTVGVLKERKTISELGPEDLFVDGVPELALFDQFSCALAHSG
jgi:hypothetical protein